MFQLNKNILTYLYHTKLTTIWFDISFFLWIKTNEILNILISAISMIHAHNHRDMGKRGRLNTTREAVMMFATCFLIAPLNTANRSAKLFCCPSQAPRPFHPLSQSHYARKTDRCRRCRCRDRQFCPFLSPSIRSKAWCRFLWFLHRDMPSKKWFLRFRFQAPSYI